MFLLAFIVYIGFFSSSYSAAEEMLWEEEPEEDGRDKRLAFFGPFVAFQIRLLIKYFASVGQQ